MADIDWTSLANTALGLGATIYSQKKNEKAINDATGRQVDAARQAQQAITSVASQDPTTLPGYEFTRKQGEESIMRNLRATGQAQSGAALKALQGYNTDLANQTYGQNFNRGLTVGQLAGNYGMQGAGFGAEGTLGQAQNQNSMISGIGGILTDPTTQKTIKDLIGSYTSQYGKKTPQATNINYEDYLEPGVY